MQRSSVKDGLALFSICLVSSRRARAYSSKSGSTPASPFLRLILRQCSASCATAGCCSRMASAKNASSASRRPIIHSSSSIQGRRFIFLPASSQCQGADKQLFHLLKPPATACSTTFLDSLPSPALRDPSKRELPPTFAQYHQHQQFSPPAPASPLRQPGRS